MNIRPQEVTENGERTVRYKGSDGKFHNIAAGSQGSQQGSTPTDSQTEQSVVVGSVTIVNDKPTITVDELLADRFYKIDSDNGGCLVATSMEDGELALRIIGNSKTGLDSKVVETVVLDEQEHWVLTLSGWAVNPVMTLLSDRDTLKQLTLNHQELFEDFLNYTQLGSATYDNGARDRTIFKTFRLSNYTATVGSFKFKEVNDKLVMEETSGDIIWGFSVFKLTGVLGTLVSYADEAHVRKVNWNQWLEPANGAKIILFGEDSYIDVYSTISDSVYIDESVELNGKGYFLLEYLCLPDESMPSGYSCFVVVNGKPTVLTQKERNTHGGA